MSTADARLAAVARSHGLDATATEALSGLVALVAADPLAPTTVRDARRIVDEHIADSLVALELDPVRNATAVVDIGSGAGFPGLPLAIARPDVDFALLESNARKCSFIERGIRTTGITNARPVQARAEEFSDGLERFDLATARAVASLAVLAEYAAPLLAIGGALVAWRGRRDLAAERDAAVAGGVLGLNLHEPVHVQPFPGAEHRYLHVMLKVRATPERFPRRPGVALKRPLGAASGSSSDRPRR